ncbi:MAG: hypothetical protein RMJ43_14805 [Chloroherpetonaceae bacterium]|nr:hypothetical protein [Chthonomonadaceae bacterium]MDW8209103.1 hypothetical protein [Chloroherpetonaceae bacterium]
MSSHGWHRTGSVEHALRYLYRIGMLRSRDGAVRAGGGAEGRVEPGRAIWCGNAPVIIDGSGRMRQDREGNVAEAHQEVRSALT